jgi:hypothetical protein
MKTSEKFKICPSCDGKAPLEVVICPYCAQSFNQTQNKSSFAASYIPPYSADRVTPSQTEAKANKISKEPTAEVDKQEKSVFLPIALLIIGSNLLILSLLLLILGKEGKLELEWSSSYWSFYALLGAPLLFFGYRLAKKEA